MPNVYSIASWEFYIVFLSHYRKCGAMAVDPQAGGHRFGFITGLCMRYKMPLHSRRAADRNARGERGRATTADQSIAGATSIVSTGAEQPPK